VSSKTFSTRRADLSLSSVQAEGGKTKKPLSCEKGLLRFNRGRGEGA
jgi:hypothetical protein